MEVYQSQEKQNIKDDSKESPKKIFDIKKSKIKIISNTIDKIKPADPLINRKYIKFKPIKYPLNYRPVLKLPSFNDNIISYNQKFELILKKEQKTDNLNNSDKKEFHINNYINRSNVISRLIYAKYPKVKDENYTIDNIINCSNNYRNINKRNIFNSNENLNKLGLSPEDIINFESNFESGNLKFVYLINPEEEEESELIRIENINNNYELILQNDTNTRGHSQWFFFRISNGKKGQKIKLNIMNFQRKKTKYSLGIKIWYFSQKKKEEKNIGWHHTEEKIEYFPNFLYNFNKGKRNNYYTLSFEYTFEYDNDEVYFANSLPFFYSDVIKDLSYYMKKENEKYFFFERKILCSTLIGNDINYFNINNNNELLTKDKNNKKNKKGIVLLARQHPGETVGSWMIKGAYEFLMGFNEEAKYLRDNYIIKVIPMVNVDGVISGNSRTSLSGCDLNRRWINPDEYIHPEIYYLKELITNFKKSVNIEYIIDFHGHFGIFNSFFYGNNDNSKIKYCKYFPFVCGKISDIISFEKSSFAMPRSKNGTARINLFDELGIENIFTLETSYFGCNQGKYKNQYFNIEILKEIGRDICRGILLCNYNKDNNLNFELKKNILEINQEFNEYISNLDKKNNKDILEDIDISDSESEPSRDNLEEEEVRKLFDFFNKRKIRKITKRRKFNSFLRNNNNNILFKKKHLSELKSKIIEINKNQSIGFPKIEKNTSISHGKKYLKLNINSLLTNINNNTNNNTKTSIVSEEISSRFIYKNKEFKFCRVFNNKLSTGIPTNSNTVMKTYEEKETQTEERFFMLHWTYFFGTFKIVTPKIDQNKIILDSQILNSLFLKKSKFKSVGTMTSSPYKKIKVSSKDNNNTDNNRSRNKNNNQNTKRENNKNIKYIFNSDFDKFKRFGSLVIKNDYKKIVIKRNNRFKSNKPTNLKNNKMKSIIIENPRNKIMNSLISSFPTLRKDDNLKRYLDDENRIKFLSNVCFE